MPRLTALGFRSDRPKWLSVAFTREDTKGHKGDRSLLTLITAKNFVYH